MLGDSILVAPIFNEDGSNSYLPQGNWTNFIRERNKGGGWIKETHDYLSVPIMIVKIVLLLLDMKIQNQIMIMLMVLELHLFAFKMVATQLPDNVRNLEGKLSLTATCNSPGQVFAGNVYSESPNHVHCYYVV